MKTQESYNAAYGLGGLNAATAVYGTVRTVVWVDGGSNPASYPIQNDTESVNQQFTEVLL